jgi:hypothetical protein
MLIAPRNRLPNRGWSTPKNGKKLSAKKRAKKSFTFKRPTKQGKCPKWDPKRPVKQGTLKIGTHPKRRAPKLVSKWAQSYTYVQHSALGGFQSERSKCMGTYPWKISKHLSDSFQKIQKGQNVPERVKTAVCMYGAPGQPSTRTSVIGTCNHDPVWDHMYPV